MYVHCSFCGVLIVKGMSRFSIPNRISEENVKIWKKCAGFPANKKFTQHHRVCASHFESKYIWTYQRHKRLRSNAVPTIGVDDSCQVVRLVNFLNCQQNQTEDRTLFFGDTNKCRCCFTNLTEVTQYHVIESWHRTAFFNMTNVELSCNQDAQDHHLCTDCSEILKKFSDLRKAAGNMQKRYYEFIRNLVDIRIKREDDFDDTFGDYVVTEPDIPSQLIVDCDVIPMDCTIIDEDDKNDVDIDLPETFNMNIKQELLADQMLADEECELIEEMVKIEHNYCKKGGVPSRAVQLPLPECYVKLRRLHKATIKKYARKKKNKEKKYSCDVCGIKLTHKYQLNRHFKTRHLAGEFRCKVAGCNKKFKNNEGLCAHDYAIHQKLSQVINSMLSSFFYSY